MTPAASLRPAGGRVGAPVLRCFIDAISWPTAIERIAHWAGERESRYVCACNAHSVVTSTREADFRSAVSGADMVTADGMPVAWMLRRLGHPEQQRINGPDLMWKLAAVAAERGYSIFLYGNTPDTLETLRTRLEAAFQVVVAGCNAPPFRDLSMEEDDAAVRRINDSGAAIVFVSLGCPKQELWMAAHRGRVNAVMIGVGMAFGYHAGTVRRAPALLQKAGLEWLFRLCSEPARLWRRYLVTNTLFIFGAAVQILLQSAPPSILDQLGSAAWVVSSMYFES